MFQHDVAVSPIGDFKHCFNPKKENGARDRV